MHVIHKVYASWFLEQSWFQRRILLMKSKRLGVWLVGPSHTYHAFPYNQVNKTNSVICAKCKSLQICHGKTGTQLFKDDFFILYVFMPVCVFIWVWARVQVSMRAQRGHQIPWRSYRLLWTKPPYISTRNPTPIFCKNSEPSLQSWSTILKHLFQIHYPELRFINLGPRIMEGYTIYQLLVSWTGPGLSPSPVSIKCCINTASQYIQAPISLCPITPKSQGSPPLPTGTPVPSASLLSLMLPFPPSPFPFIAPVYSWSLKSTSPTNVSQSQFRQMNSIQSLQITINNSVEE